MSTKPCVVTIYDPSPLTRVLPTHELNGRRRRKRVERNLPASQKTEPATTPIHRATS